ncbi:hypothetical protein D3C86_944050 [compost metagenome]
MPSMCARRPLRSPTTSPRASSGAEIATSRMGSSKSGWASAKTLRMARFAAVLKAISELSTEWEEPSYSVTLTSTMG